MTVVLRLFALLRERVGVPELRLDLPAGATVADARDALAAAQPTLANMLPRVRFAVNQSYAALDAELHEGDEVAAIPPVSGG